MRSARDDAGFTVVELLIALSIISLVMVTLLSAFGFGRIAVNSARETRRQLDELALLHSLLMDALSQITVSFDGSPSLTGNNQRLVAVIAVPRLLSFLAPPVRLSLQPDPAGGGLIASWNSESVPVEPVEHRIVAVERRIRFSYFKPAAGWFEIWDEPRQLPSAVRVSTWDDAETRQQTLLEIPVRALVSQACATQPRAPACGFGR